MDAREWFEHGKFKLVEGILDESIEAFTRALEMGYHPVITHLSRGVAYLNIKNADKAIEDFSAVVDSDKDNHRALYYRGTAAMLKGHYRAAIDDFSRVLALQPEHGGALLSRGVCYGQVGSEDEAAADMKRALMIAERDAQHFAETHLGWRTHLDGTLGVLHPHGELTEEDVEKLKGFFEDSEKQ